MSVITYAIDTERVLEHIYAYCAIDFFTSKDSRPEVLGRDQSAALRRVITNVAAELLYHLGPAVRETSLLDNPEDTIITMQLEMSRDDSLANLRPLLESALAASVMSVVYAGANAYLSSTYATLYERQMSDLSRLIYRSGRPGFIEAA